MKITSIRTVVCNAEMRNWVFVRIDTDQDGLFGWGEATLEWKTRAVLGAIEDLAPMLIGQDPRDIEQALQIMTRHSFWRMGIIGMSAISGIEIALWDILGKSCGEPVWRLLGGKCRDHLRTYTHLGMGDMRSVYETASSQILVERAGAVVAAGYDAIKVVPLPYCHYAPSAADIDHVARMMEDLRAAVGPGIDIMVDFHGRPPSRSAARDFISVVAPIRPLFIEEPLPPEDPEGLAHLTATSPVAIAAGERLVARREFIPAIQAHAFDIAQPDICHTGGLLETKKIAALAESAGIGVAPHNPLGPVAGIAALHFGIATPNFIIQEEMSGAVPWYDDVVTWSATRRPGRWDLPQGPGLGVTINEAEVARHPFRQEILHARHAVLPDGTVVDW